MHRAYHRKQMQRLSERDAAEAALRKKRVSDGQQDAAELFDHREKRREKNREKHKSALSPFLPFLFCYFEQFNLGFQSFFLIF